MAGFCFLDLLENEAMSQPLSGGGDGRWRRPELGAGRLSR